MAAKSDFHEDFSRQEKIEGSTDRGFGLVFAAFFALLSALAIWHNKPHWYWWVGLAVLTLVIALTIPSALGPFNRLWIRLGLILFKVISPLMLAVIFFSTMTPMAMFLRLRKKDILRLKYDLGTESYWIRRDPPGPSPDSMKNQF